MVIAGRDIEESGKEMGRRKTGASVKWGRKCASSFHSSSQLVSTVFIVRIVLFDEYPLPPSRISLTPLISSLPSRPHCQTVSREFRLTSDSSVLPSQSGIPTKKAIKDRILPTSQPTIFLALNNIEFVIAANHLGHSNELFADRSLIPT